jgi:hypothetical protein
MPTKAKGAWPARAKASTLDARRDSRGRVLPGSSLGGTRKGSPNRSTLAGKELLAHLEAGDSALGLRPALERWVALLNDPDAAIRLGCEKFLHEALYGRTKQEGAGAVSVVEIRVTYENDWRAMRTPSGSAVRVIEERKTAQSAEGDTPGMWIGGERDSRAGRPALPLLRGCDGPSR